MVNGMGYMWFFSGGWLKNRFCCLGHGDWLKRSPTTTFGDDSFCGVDWAFGDGVPGSKDSWSSQE